MSSDFLSQEEIDALLHGGPSNNNLDPDEYLTLFDRDALGEVGNISFGTAATTLSTLLRQKVNITTPEVILVRREDFVQDFPIPHVAARVEYTEGLQGANILMIQMNDAQIIADLMLGGDGLSPATELNELHMSAVGEAMNQMMGSASTSMSTMVNRPVNISPPIVKSIDETSGETLVPESDVLVKISFHLQVGDLIDSHIMQVIPIEFARALVDMVMAASGDSDDRSVSSGALHSSGGVAPAPSGHTFATPDAHPEPLREQMRASVPRDAISAGQQRTVASDTAQAPVVVERAMFSAFDEPAPQQGGRNLDLLLDIPLELTVEIGRTKKLIRDILELGPGSIVELEALAGEPVDILVNSKLIARGEVVVIDENFGVRVTDIVSPAERIKHLQ